MFCTGEVYNGDPASACPLQENLDSIINFPMYVSFAGRVSQIHSHSAAISTWFEHSIQQAEISRHWSTKWRMCSKNAGISTSSQRSQRIMISQDLRRIQGICRLVQVCVCSNGAHLRFLSLLKMSLPTTSLQMASLSVRSPPVMYVIATDRLRSLLWPGTTLFWRFQPRQSRSRVAHRVQYRCAILQAYRIPQ